MTDLTSDTIAELRRARESAEQFGMRSPAGEDFYDDCIRILPALLDRVEAAEAVATEMEADARERWDPMSEPEDGMYSTQKVFHMAAQLLGKEDR